MFIIRIAERGRVNPNNIKEWYYSGRRKSRDKSVVCVSKQLDCAKRFKTMRGARQALRLLEGKLDIKASRISSLEGYVERPLLRYSEAEQRYVIA